jgi:hypothetical protein
MTDGIDRWYMYRSMPFIYIYIYIYMCVCVCEGRTKRLRALQIRQLSAEEIRQCRAVEICEKDLEIKSILT